MIAAGCAKSWDEALKSFVHTVGYGGRSGRSMEGRVETAVPRVYFVKEVAEMMRMSPATVYNAIYEGELRAERYGTGKNSIRIDRAAFEEWRERHRFEPVAANGSQRRANA